MGTQFMKNQFNEASPLAMPGESTRQSEIVRNVIQTVARGNINLQLGRYITETDKEKLRKSMREYKFNSPKP